MKKILILQPFLDQSISIAFFLRRFSSEYYLIAGIFNERIPYVPSCVYHEIKNIKHENLGATSQYDFILPTGAQSTKFLLSLVESITIGTIKFKKENLIVFDKKSTLAIIRKIGIPVPKMYDSIDHIEGYPAFYKQAFESGVGIRGIIYSQDDLKTIPLHEKLIFQEYINTPETYGVGFIARDGQIITHFIHKEIISYPKPGGSGVLLTKYQDDRLLLYSRKIINHLHYSGWGLIEFKYCNKRKDFVFMEVNAKFWASIEFALLNNPVFFQELFDIQYTPKKGVNCIIFLDRLAQYGIIEYLTYIASFIKCHKLHFRQSIFILILNAIPPKLKLILKFNIH